LAARRRRVMSPRWKNPFCERAVRRSPGGKSKLSVLVFRAAMVWEDLTSVRVKSGVVKSWMPSASIGPGLGGSFFFSVSCALASVARDRMIDRRRRRGADFILVMFFGGARALGSA